MTGDGFALGVVRLPSFVWPRHTLVTSCRVSHPSPGAPGLDFQTWETTNLCERIASVCPTAGGQLAKASATASGCRAITVR